MQETHVYVVTHKEFDDKCYKEYIPIAVGKNLLENNQCHYQKDNVGENISMKNPNFCELTAQYWIWKNDIEVGIK